MTIRQLTPLASRVIASTAILVMVAGSVLVFFIPREQIQGKPKKLEIAQSEFKFDSITPHELVPKKVAPSKVHVPVTKKPVARTSSAPAAGRGKPQSSGTTPVATPRTTPKPIPSPKPSPSSRPSSTPTLTPKPTPTPTPTSVIWKTSAEAVQAAQRMEAAATVGDPVCSRSGSGSTTVDVPSGVKTVYSGISGNYWCLIYEY